MDWRCFFLSPSLSLHLPASFFLSFFSHYPSIHPCIHPSIHLSDHLSIYLSICLSICTPVCLYVCIPLCLSVCLPVYLSACVSVYHVSVYVSICLPVYLCIMYLSMCLSVCLCICVVYLSVCLSIFSLFLYSIYLFVCLSIYLYIWNEAILRDFLTKTDAHSSNTKQLCETSSRFEIDNVKNQAMLQDFLQKMESWCRTDGLVPMRFAIFPLHLSKVLYLPRKNEARSNEVLLLSRNITLANLQIWCSKMQPLSGHQNPDLLISLMIMSLVLRLSRNMYLYGSSSNIRRLLSFLELLQSHHLLRCRIPCACHAKRHPNVTTSERP